MAKDAQKLWSADAHDILRVGEGFQLADVDPDSQPGFDGDKADVKKSLAEGDDAARAVGRDRSHVAPVIGFLMREDSRYPVAGKVIRDNTVRCNRARQLRWSVAALITCLSPAGRCSIRSSTTAITRTQ